MAEDSGGGRLVWIRSPNLRLGKPLPQFEAWETSHLFSFVFIWTECACVFSHLVMYASWNVSGLGLAIGVQIANKRDL